MEITYLNCIINKEEIINITYPKITYNEWKVYSQYNTNKEICDKLDSLLSITSDTYIDYNMHYTQLPIYKANANEYYYFLLKLTDYKLYNEYLDKFISFHQNNIALEYKYPIKTKPIKKSNTRKVPNRFIKMETKDLFTGKTKYIYTNPKTKEEIESFDGNLLEELNAKKKRVKRTKVVSVGKLIFNFNIKKK